MTLDIPIEAVAKPDDTEDRLAALREKALTASYDEYKELTAAWRSIDTKAQGNITVAGIFIAGAFAYLTKIDRPPAPEEKWIFVLAMIFLLMSVVLSVLVLRIREVPPHYLGGFMIEMVERVGYTKGREFQDYVLRFYNLHARRWGEANQRLNEANKEKGEFLWAAQVFLLVAIFTAAILVIIKLLY